MWINVSRLPLSFVWGKRGIFVLTSIQPVISSSSFFSSSSSILWLSLSLFFLLSFGFWKRLYAALRRNETHIHDTRVRLFSPVYCCFTMGQYRFVFSKKERTIIKRCQENASSTNCDCAVFRLVDILKLSVGGLVANAWEGFQAQMDFGAESLYWHHRNVCLCFGIFSDNN